MKTLRIKTILVPIDFSDRSIQAITFAKNFASPFNAAVHLLHVHEFYCPDGCFAAAPMGVPAMVVPDWSHTIAQQMDASLLQKLEDVAVCSNLSPNNCYVKRGAPIFDEICQCARTVGADLIVTATHGRGVFQQLLLGSTAERLVQHSPCPVLVTRPKMAKAVGGNEVKNRISRILVPVDFSHCSAAGLRYAIELTRKLGSQITILHVVDFGSILTADGYAMYDLSRYQRIACKEAQREMRDFLRPFNLESVDFETKIVADLFLDGINSMITKADIDLVVTATHGRTGFRHVLIGSNAELMVRRAACPVLVVPSHPTERIRNLGIVAKRHRSSTHGRPKMSAASNTPRLTKRDRKIATHPFPERRKTNKFRESHLVS